MATYTARCSPVGGFSYANNFMLYVILNETNISTENNSSRISYDVYCQSSGSGSINAIHFKYFNLNGQDIINANANVNVSSPNAYISIASGTTGDIVHNNDGSKSVNFRAILQGSRYGVSASVEGTFVLSTIPRASSIACTTANITESAVITINSAVSSFRHNVYADFGNLHHIDINSNCFGGSFQWTIPKEFYAQIPNSKSGEGIITCDTMQNGIFIGTKNTRFTVTTNEEKCKPDLEATLIDINEDTVNLTGDNKKIVMYKSTANISIAAISKNSASISSKRVNNELVTNNNISIAEVKTNSFVVSVTDSRGYSNSITIKPESINYIPLTINANIKRIQPTKGDVAINFSGNYFNNSFGNVDNELLIELYYREKNSENWISGGFLEKTIEKNIYNNGDSPIFLGINFDYKKTYEFYLLVKDKLTILQPTFTITEGIPIFNWTKDLFNINGNLCIYEKQLLPQILFEDKNGTTKDITLNEEIENFDELEIKSYVIYSEDKVYTSTGKLPIDTKKRIHINNEFIATNSQVQKTCKRISISGKNLTVISDRNYNSSTSTGSNGEFTYITEVLGYKSVTHSIVEKGGDIDG